MDDPNNTASDAPSASGTVSSGPSSLPATGSATESATGSGAIARDVSEKAVASEQVTDVHQAQGTEQAGSVAGALARPTTSSEEEEHRRRNEEFHRMLLQEIERSEDSSSHGNSAVSDKPIK